jgi:uncharacterized protein YkwD
MGACTSAGISAAGETVANAFPLLRWTTAPEVRRQPEELWRLVDLMNALRRSRGLPEAPLSPRLTVVAFEHVKDLIHNRPHAAGGSLHSWSPGAFWSGGVYRPEEKTTWPVMWDKPREIAGYDGYGFEIAASNIDDADHALQAWRSSPAHLDVILSRGVWSNPRWRWKAMGAVFYRGFACAWFGPAEDSPPD